MPRSVGVQVQETSPKLLAFEVKTRGRWLEKDELQRSYIDTYMLMLKVYSPCSLRSRSRARTFLRRRCSSPISTEKGTSTVQTLLIATVQSITSNCENEIFKPVSFRCTTVSTIYTFEYTVHRFLVITDRPLYSTCVVRPPTMVLDSYDYGAANRRSSHLYLINNLSQRKGVVVNWDSWCRPS